MAGQEIFGGTSADRPGPFSYFAESEDNSSEENFVDVGMCCQEPLVSCV